MPHYSASGGSRLKGLSSGLVLKLTSFADSTFNFMYAFRVTVKILGSWQASI